MKKKEIMQIILEFIHSETGWGAPLRPYCEFEELHIKEIKEKDDGSYVVAFKYHFDEDGFSQYDKTHILEGKGRMDPNGELLEWSLEETHTGVDTHYYYGSKKKAEDKMKPLINKLEKLQAQLGSKGLNREDYEKLNQEVEVVLKKIEALKKNT
ncbi:MAG: hypothetical protein ACFFDN_35760 [Candidatus Hodarchaeota archaeon]